MDPNLLLKTTGRLQKGTPNSSDALINQQMPHVLSAPASSRGSSCFRNAIGSTIQLTSKASSCPISSLGSNTIAVNAKIKSNLNVVCASNKDLSLPSKAIDDRFSASTARLTPSSPQHFQKSSYERPRSRADYTKVQTNSFANTESGSGSVSVHSDSIGRSEKPNSTRAKKNKAQSKVQVLNTRGYRQRVSETEENGAAHKFSQPLKSSRLQAHSAKLPMNSLFTIEQYHQVLQRQKWGSSAEVCLNNLEHKLDAFQANQVLKLVHDHSIALGFSDG
ncbi:Pentatricopeptide repeat-containing protein [Platanthera zijinensis]|uniref:Pentatricopeptide repeat-containing protein n=1 Tax=Platanthera zijinensis TaxID=2320716 RepID=A0AAP0BMN9_9ASPA